MIPEVTIRDEAPKDHVAIHALTRDAFAPMPYSDGTEADLIDQLRRDGDLRISLVAEAHDIIGHVAFSPARIGTTPGRWYALGPISVRADMQKQGLGTRLAKAGLARLAKMGAGCVLIGSPHVYGPMGFVSDGLLSYGGLDPRLVQYVVLTGSVPQGEVTFAPALQQDQP
jgi:putative acetyltransferase